MSVILVNVILCRHASCLCLLSVILLIISVVISVGLLSLWVRLLLLFGWVGCWPLGGGVAVNIRVSILVTLIELLFVLLLGVLKHGVSLGLLCSLGFALFSFRFATVVAVVTDKRIIVP